MAIRTASSIVSACATIQDNGVGVTADRAADHGVDAVVGHGTSLHADR